jgi:hypothetical protein
MTLLSDDVDRALYSSVYAAALNLYTREDNARDRMGTGDANDPLEMAYDLARLAVLEARSLAGDAFTTTCLSMSPTGARCARGTHHRGLHSVRTHRPYVRASGYGGPDPRAKGGPSDWTNDEGKLL